MTGKVLATREELFQAVADTIGWGSSDDIVSMAEEIEALGVRFVPSSLLTPEQAKANPYAPGKE
jgi:hypothetical protein